MGIFRIYNSKGELLNEFTNRFVDSGKQFALNYMFNSSLWNTGSTARYIGIGTSTNTNGGVVGPTGSTYVSVSGSWHGPAETDWHLSSEITGSQRATAVCTMAGNSALLLGTITDDNVDYALGETSVDIVEFGIFLTSGYGEPAGDPTLYGAIDSDKYKAMLVRAVSVKISGTDYVQVPITKTQGDNLIIQYLFGDFEG